METKIRLKEIAGRIISALQSSNKIPNPGLLSFGMWMHTNMLEEDIVFLQTLDDDLANEWLISTLIDSGHYVLFDDTLEVIAA